jgi:GT2 family glycosyltransferase
VGGAGELTETDSLHGERETGAQPAVSVVVCAYTEARLDSLHRLLDALPQQTRPPAEVILVADGGDRLAATFRRRFPDALVVVNDGPHGHAGAANRGVSAARGEVVAFIDDDAAPADERWLEWLTHGYSEPHVLGTGGRVEPRWRTARPGWFPDEFLWVVGATHRGMAAGGGAVRNVWMGNMSVRRTLFDEVGGFRTSLSRVGTKPFGVQETEFCVRAAHRRPGGVFLYEPRARVVHDVPAARATFAYFRSHCFDEAVAKVEMARHVGARSGLAAERAYLARVLPGGVVRGLADAALRRDPAGLGRAGAIVAGAAVAACGYTRARLRPAARPGSDDLAIDVRPIGG